MDKVFCAGIECPVKNTCMRYTKGLGVTMYEGTSDTFIRKCTNQKKYMQDVTKVTRRA